MRRPLIHWLGRSALAVLTTSIGVLSAHATEPREPKVPPGLPPGGLPVAAIGLAVDYRAPVVANCIARDGEGVPIAFDFRDGDVFPFGTKATDQQVAATLCGAPRHVALIAVATQTGQTQHLIDAVRFAVQTPARIVLFAGGENRQLPLPVLISAAAAFPDRLVIAGGVPVAKSAPIPSPDRAQTPKIFPANLIIVRSAGPNAEASAHYGKTGPTRLLIEPQSQSSGFLNTPTAYLVRALAALSDKPIETQEMPVPKDGRATEAGGAVDAAALLARLSKLVGRDVTTRQALPITVPIDRLKTPQLK
ncbi:MAG: hypothetical protein AAFY53_12755 [Pseudomonadota bacterium]